MIHADPHPGNFLVMPDGRLGILDFGAIRSFPDAFVHTNRWVLEQALAGEDIDVKRALRELGFTLELPEDEAVPLVRDVLHIVGKALKSDCYDYAQDTSTREMKLYAAKHALQLFKIKPPPEGMLFFRAAAGCTQNLKALGAKGDFRSVYRELSPKT